MATHEREITGPVDLCRADGALNPDAAGWSRRPVHRTAVPGWGRTKKWEYWAVATPTHLVALTLADIDYLGLAAVYLVEFGGVETGSTGLSPGAAAVRLPDTLDGGPAASVGPVRAAITPTPSGTRLRFSCRTAEGPLSGDLEVALPDGHEVLSVVVPWSGRRFQYTSKHTARPASGEVRLGGRAIPFDGGWGVLDHGRGRWPYSTAWNWGAASGTAAGHTVGLQFGGGWTAGTGTTENALSIDGRLTKIGEELDWEYDTADFTAPWRLRTPASDRVDLVFTPVHERADRIWAGPVSNDTHQCFGHYSGTVRPDEGGPIRIDGLLGWAEQVRMRW